MKKTHKIAFYTVGNHCLPSTRFRILQYFPALRNAGIEFEYYGLAPTKGSGLRGLLELFRQGVVRWFQLGKVSKYDLLVIQKGLTFWRCRGLAERLLAAGVPYVVDIDDSVNLQVPIQLPRALRWLQDEEELTKLFRGACRIVVGNRFLEESVMHYGKPISIIPTPIDTEQYRIPLKEGPKKTVIGWSGSSSTNFYVNRVIPVLKELSNRHEFKFLIISNDLNHIEIEKLQGIDYQFVPWRKETEVEDLQKIDIGLMPLSDDVWSKGKCGLKALQYMALGAPSVCSPVGVNSEIIDDGANGFLADRQEEWVAKLELLLQDAEKRKRLGKNARKTVEERFSLKVNMPKLVSIIEDALLNGKR